MSQSGGGKLTGTHYYRVAIPEPMSSELAPYVAECADIIEALGMTFNEGEAFKAIWRLAAGRTLGLQKNNPQYDADKAAHYAERLRVVYSRHTPTNQLRPTHHGNDQGTRSTSCCPGGANQGREGSGQGRA